MDKGDQVSEKGVATSVFGRLLWPERTPLSDADRRRAADRIDDARSTGLLTEEQALRRRAVLPDARTRDDLRDAVGGLPGTTPAGLLVARRVIAGLWLAVTVIQFDIWLLICLIGWHLINPWWLWTLVGGAIVVGGLWWATESEYRGGPA